ncbi:MAG: hypothetical protein ACJAXM_001645, partial [Arenicella sp.]
PIVNILDKKQIIFPEHGEIFQTGMRYLVILVKFRKIIETCPNFGHSYAVSESRMMRY